MSEILANSTSYFDNSESDEECESISRIVPLTIEATNCYLKSNTYKEYIDIGKVKALIESNDICDVWKDYNGFSHDDKKTLQKILNNVDDSGDIPEIDVTYRSNTKWGRIYPKGLISLGSMERGIRHYLASEYYYDVDIVNCHLELLRCLCEEWNIPHKRLKSYCKNRDKIIEEYKKKYGFTRSQTKTLFISLINGGKTTPHFRGINKEHIDALKFQLEMKNISKHIIKKIPKQLRKKLLAGGQTWNTNGRLMARYLQMYEQQILQLVFSNLKDDDKINDKNNCSLCHDGLLVPKASFDSEEACQTYLMNVINPIVKEETGFSIRFIVKEMNEPFVRRDTKKTIEKELVKQNISTTVVKEEEDPYKAKYGISKYVVPDTNDYDLGKLFYEKQADKYTFSTGSNGKRVGYKFNKNGLYREISNECFTNEVVEYFRELVDNMKEKIRNAPVDEPAIGPLMIVSKIDNSAKNRNIVTRIIERLTDDNFEKLLDTDKTLLGFNNGVYDLKTHAFRAARKEDYVFMTCGYDYQEADPNIVKEVEEFIQEMFPKPEDAKEFLIILSRSLEGINYEEIGVFCIGGGGNGKGLLFGDCIKGALGDYYATLDGSYFTEHKTDTRNPALYSARKARLLNVTEPQKQKKVLTDTFKASTGRDEIMVRTNYQKKDTAMVFPPLFFQSNHFIRLESDTEGNSVKRRLRSVLFPYTFVPEKELKRMKNNKEDISNFRIQNSKLKILMKNPDYKRAMMKLLLDHYKEYKKRQGKDDPGVQMTDFMKESTDTYFKNISDEKEWFYDNIEKNGNQNILVSSLFEKYRQDEKSSRNLTWFRNKIKEFGYTYKTRVVGTNIHTNQKKQGACVMNVTYVGETIENNTFNWLNED